MGGGRNRRSCASLGRSAPQLRFHGRSVLGSDDRLLCSLQASPVELVVDTGNQGGSQLWDRFARDFPQPVSEGRKGTKVVHKIGGSEERQIVIIPEIRLRVGGFDSVLQPATVFSKPIDYELPPASDSASASANSRMTSWARTFTSVLLSKW